MDEEAPKLEEMFADVWDRYNMRIHEDVSPPASKHAHGRLPRAYPALPSFGILYLSLRRATALIVRDMYERNRPPFNSLTVGTPGFAEELAKVQAELTPKIREHLVRAIEKGGLPAVHPTNSFQHFVEFGDESEAASSYIYYGDLVNWLVNSGYEDSRFLAVGPAFEAYEQQELTLGKEVEHYLQKRRECPGASASERGDQGAYLDDAYTDYLYDALRHSNEVITDLKQRLDTLRSSPAFEQLQPREQDTLFVFVNSLLKLLEEKGRIKSIQQQAEELGQEISPNTIRKWVREAEKRSGERKVN